MRYEIETSHPGVILESGLVTHVITTRAIKRPTVIVFVDIANKKKFEKYIEGHTDVIGYRADSRSQKGVEKDWKRP